MDKQQKEELAIRGWCVIGLAFFNNTHPFLDWKNMPSSGIRHLLL